MKYYKSKRNHIFYRNPMNQFEEWFLYAKDMGVMEPNAMIISTLSTDLHPSSRTVMLKAYDDRGFIFFTDCKSKKAQHIKNNPNVSLIFLWLELDRQIKIEGTAKKISLLEIFSYFSDKSGGMGSWINESGKFKARLILEKQFLDALLHLKNSPVKFSNIICGYRVTPNMVEFWQGNEKTLYESFIYTKTDKGWNITS